MAAVLNLCRLPCLATAFARRMLGVLTVAFFKDNATVNLLIAEGWGQASLQYCFLFFGAIVSVAKSFPMAQSWTLGRHTWMVTC